MKPDWLDEALAGHPVVLRNGCLGYVRHYETSLQMNKPLLGVIIGKGKVHPPAAWSISGEYSASQPHISDIRGLHINLEFLGWDVLNEFTRYIAKDADGCWYGYTSRPTIPYDTRGWAVDTAGEDSCPLTGLKKELFPECDWKQSLIERPSEE